MISYHIYHYVLFDKKSGLPDSLSKHLSIYLFPCSLLRLLIFIHVVFNHSVIPFSPDAINILYTQ